MPDHLIFLADGTVKPFDRFEYKNLLEHINSIHQLRTALSFQNHLFSCVHVLTVVLHDGTNSFLYEPEYCSVMSFIHSLEDSRSFLASRRQYACTNMQSWQNTGQHSPVFNTDEPPTSFRTTMLLEAEEIGPSFTHQAITAGENTATDASSPKSDNITAVAHFQNSWQLKSSGERNLAFHMGVLDMRVSKLRQKSQDQRKHTAEIRRIGACLRCRMLNRKCSGTLPCDNCSKLIRPTGLWAQPCFRASSNEFRIFARYKQDLAYLFRNALSEALAIDRLPKGSSLIQDFLKFSAEAAVKLPNLTSGLKIFISQVTSFVKGAILPPIWWLRLLNCSYTLLVALVHRMRTETIPTKAAARRLVYEKWLWYFFVTRLEISDLDTSIYTPTNRPCNFQDVRLACLNIYLVRYHQAVLDFVTWVVQNVHPCGYGPISMPEDISTLGSPSNKIWTDAKDLINRIPPRYHFNETTLSAIT